MCGLTSFNIVYPQFRKCYFIDVAHLNIFPLKVEGKFVFQLFVSSFLSLSFSLLFYHKGSLVPHHQLPFPQHQSFNLGVPKPSPLQMVRSIINKPPSRDPYSLPTLTPPLHLGQIQSFTKKVVGQLCFCASSKDAISNFIKKILCNYFLQELQYAVGSLLSC